MNLGEINPFIRRAFLLNHAPSKKTVKNADSRLFYVIEGEGEIVLDGKTYPFKNGALGLWKAGTEYCWKFSKTKNSRLLILNFDYTEKFSYKTEWLPLITKENSFESELLDTGCFEDAHHLNKPIFLNNMHLFKEEILSITDEFEAKKLHSAELSSAMLKQLIIKLARFTSSVALPQTKIEKLIEYIKLNYNKEITNISLGQLVNYHPHYINVLMKAYTGVTLHAYLIDCRLSAALKLVVNTNEGIEDIALKVGFKNATHFCNAFRKKYSVSPSVYRKMSKII